MSLKNRWLWVNWVDSAGPSTRWEYTNNLEADHAARATTVGYCVTDNEEYLNLASTIAHEGDKESEQATAVMTIPWCTVIGVFEIE